jgi:hypothetical protein
VTFNIIGGTKTGAVHTTGCHCGDGLIQLHLASGVENPRRCNCSIPPAWRYL